MHEMGVEVGLFVFLAFFVAGCVKGVVGMGLPTVAVGLLGLVIAPSQAAALLIVPSLVTNVWQLFAGPNYLQLVRRLWPMLLPICIATWAAAGLIAHGGATYAERALGSALILYSILGLAKVQMCVSRRRETWLSPITGIATGIVTGATGVMVIPAVPYLQALGLEKNDLIQALGLSFTTSTIALAVGLISRGAFHVAAASLSSCCVVPALAGMFLGNRLRLKINPDSFRKVFFVGLLFVGLALIFRF